MKKGIVTITLLCFALLIAPFTLAKTTVTVWTPWASTSLGGRILHPMVERFNAENPDIHIELEVVAGNAAEALIVAYAGGAGPDVFIGGTGGWAAQYGGEEGIFLALDEFIDGPNGFPRSDFTDDLWSFSTVDGKVYQLASEGNERGLFINVHNAEAAGLDTGQPNPIEDWDDLLQWARRMTIRTGDTVSQWGFNANHQNGGDRFHWIYLNDGQAVSLDGKEALLDHPNTVEAVQFAADLIHEHGVAPIPGAVGGSVRANFQNGVYSMVLERSTFIPDLERSNTEYLVVPGPPGVGKHGGRLSGATASTMHILRDTEVPEAAWEVLRWFAYDAGLELADGRGGIPYLIEGLRRPQYQSEPWNAFAFQILTYQAYPDDFPGVMARHYGPFGRAWSASLSGEKAPLIALQEAKDELNAILND